MYASNEELKRKVELILSDIEQKVLAERRYKRKRTFFMLLRALGIIVSIASLQAVALSIWFASLKVGVISIISLFIFSSIGIYASAKLDDLL
jgi:hypothetical protein